MVKFKAGEKARLVKIENAFGEASDERENLPRVVVLRESDHLSYDWVAHDPETDKFISYVFERNLERLSDMEDLKIGDVLAGAEYQNNLKVENVIGRLIFTVSEGDCECANVWTAKELENEGYEVIKDTDEGTTEVTLEEVAEKMGVPVSKLRIKDGEA